MLAVARDHPFAGRKDVSIEDLADHQIGRLDITLPTELIHELAPHKTPTGRPIPARSCGFRVDFPPQLSRE
jgi:hypothetical protein